MDLEEIKRKAPEGSFLNLTLKQEEEAMGRKRKESTNGPAPIAGAVKEAVKKATRRARQKIMPGMETERIQVLEDAAHIYYDAVRERLPLTKAEDEAKDNLIDKMKEKGLDRYETADGLMVTVTAKSNVKCKPKKDAELNGEHGDEFEED